MERPLCVVHTVASTRSGGGGLRRSVPALSDALEALGISSSVRFSDTLHESLPNAISLVHDHGMWLLANHRLAQWAKKKQVVRIVSARGMLEPWALQYKKYKKRLAWLVYQRRDLQRAHVIHATSDREAEHIRQLRVTAPIAIVPNGVYIPNLPPQPQAASRRVALFLSRFHPVKGLPTLLDAWAIVEPPGWELHIVGPDETGLRASLEKHPVARHGSVHFHQEVSDSEKWKWYQRADLFVLPTRSENFGLVVAEALGAGVPVITTKGAPWAILERECCGWWTEVSIQGLVSALQEATSKSSQDLKHMGERGRQLVATEYNWLDIGRRMARVYRWVLGHAERPQFVHLD